MFFVLTAIINVLLNSEIIINLQKLPEPAEGGKLRTLRIIFYPFDKLREHQFRTSAGITTGFLLLAPLPNATFRFPTLYV